MNRPIPFWVQVSFFPPLFPSLFLWARSPKTPCSIFNLISFVTLRWGSFIDIFYKNSISENIKVRSWWSKSPLGESPRFVSLHCSVRGSARHYRAGLCWSPSCCIDICLIVYLPRPKHGCGGEGEKHTAIWIVTLLTLTLLSSTDAKFNSRQLTKCFLLHTL